MKDDTISRQAAIEVIDKIFPADPMRNDYTQGITCGAALATEYIKQLPSEQPEIANQTEESAQNVPNGELISKKAAIEALEKMSANYGKIGRREWHPHIEECKAELSMLPSAQPEIILCKDCDWWTKQEDSLQGRCDRYGMYPTGYWYCAGARERREG